MPTECIPLLDAYSLYNVCLHKNKAHEFLIFLYMISSVFSSCVWCGNLFWAPSSSHFSNIAHWNQFFSFCYFCKAKSTFLSWQYICYSFNVFWLEQLHWRILTKLRQVQVYSDTDMESKHTQRCDSKVLSPHRAYCLHCTDLPLKAPANINIQYLKVKPFDGLTPLYCLPRWNV